MSGFAGVVPGGTVREKAVALAGCLAELSQTRLLLRAGGVETPVAARVTDLPGVICGAIAEHGVVDVVAPGLGAEFHIAHDTGTWTCGDSHAAEVLRRKLHV